MINTLQHTKPGIYLEDTSPYARSYTREELDNDVLFKLTIAFEDCDKTYKEWHKSAFLYLRCEKWCYIDDINSFGDAYNLKKDVDTILLEGLQLNILTKQNDFIYIVNEYSFEYSNKFEDWKKTFTIGSININRIDLIR